MTTIATANAAWRRYGKQHRRELLQADQGNAERFFRENADGDSGRLARVLVRDFRDSCAAKTESIDDLYVQGYRLVTFLSRLSNQQRHSDYQGRQRKADVHFVCQKTEELAIEIDEEHLNLFILNDYVPDSDDEDEAGDEEEQKVSLNNNHRTQKQQLNTDKMQTKTTSWIFNPFDLSEDEAPRTVDTDTSLTTVNTSANDASFFLHRDVEDHEIDDHLNLESCSSSSNEDSFDEIRVNLSLDTLKSSMLDKLANEDVKYEIDSDAVDSWANSETFSSDITRTLSEIMNRMPKAEDRSPEAIRARTKARIVNALRKEEPNDLFDLSSVARRLHEAECEL